MSLMDKLNKALFNKLNKNPGLDPEEQHKAILKLAKTKGGTVTVSEIVLGTSLSLEEAEEMLQYFAAKGYANMRLNDSGAIVYEFPGIRTTARAAKTVTPTSKTSSKPYKTSSPQPASGKTSPMPRKTSSPRPASGKRSSMPRKQSTPRPASGKTRQTRARPSADDAFKTSGRKTAHLPDWMKKRKKNS
ncbi:hypothetical protein QUF90_11675 [Desulfococcaceae bacterium HSG9]|nr:hypothetical protein [Desulfococcaceae bacterium HSG9]